MLRHFVRLHQTVGRLRLAWTSWTGDQRRDRRTGNQERVAFDAGCQRSLEPRRRLAGAGPSHRVVIGIAVARRILLGLVRRLWRRGLFRRLDRLRSMLDGGSVAV